MQTFSLCVVFFLFCSIQVFLFFFFFFCRQLDHLFPLLKFCSSTVVTETGDLVFRSATSQLVHLLPSVWADYLVFRHIYSLDFAWSKFWDHVSSRANLEPTPNLLQEHSPWMLSLFPFLSNPFEILFFPSKTFSSCQVLLRLWTLALVLPLSVYPCWCQEHLPLLYLKESV